MGSNGNGHNQGVDVEGVGKQLARIDYGQLRDILVFCAQELLIRALEEEQKEDLSLGAMVQEGAEMLFRADEALNRAHGLELERRKREEMQRSFPTSVC